MKKIFFGFILIFVLLTKASLAQDFTYSKAYADYTFKLSEYQKVHSEYELARDSYLQSKTLAARSQAEKKTRTMLMARDEVVRTYLTAIRLRLVEIGGVFSTEKEPLFAQLDAEVAWYANHQKEVGSASSLEDLFAESSEAKTRFESQTLNIVYESLATISKGKVKTDREGLQGIVDALDAKIVEIRANGDKDTSQIERWMLDTKSKLVRSEEKIIEAQGEIVDLREEERNKLRVYNEVIFSLEESFQYLKEAVNFMKQVVQEIKTAD
jgi:hypothetical protein